jgi:ATP adenylyltransferase
MLEHLWAGWRATYVASLGPPASEGGSLFTQILRSGLPDEKTNIVYRGPSCFAILNAYPYAVGHTMVVPYREVGDLEDLDAGEAAELWATVTDVVRALKHAYHPEGLNVGLNIGYAAGGSVREHLHAHVVPRWTGDSNFMTSVANTRTLPEALVSTAARIRGAWPATPTVHDHD